jgi:hypothetical protein
MDTLKNVEVVFDYPKEEGWIETTIDQSVMICSLGYSLLLYIDKSDGRHRVFYK